MLSKKAKYAIKALILLGKNLNTTALQISEIASLENIPRKYLEGILLDLKNAGYLHSRRGTGGGYTLRVLPQEISLDKIVRLVDGPIARVSCASIFHYHKCDECRDEDSCSIRDLFAAVRDADVKILASTNIADMIQKETLLKALVDTSVESL
jgi:Rrf2 family protein